MPSSDFSCKYVGSRLVSFKGDDGKQVEYVEFVLASPTSKEGFHGNEIIVARTSNTKLWLATNAMEPFCNVSAQLDFQVFKTTVRIVLLGLKLVKEPAATSHSSASKAA